MTADKFRLRGLEMTRIETFTDAAFAFALTLLVVSLEPPTSIEGLTDILRDVPGFLLAAGLLMLFWWGHHEWSRRYGLDDGMTVLLSCMLVFTVLVFVYPLRFMAGSLVAYIGLLADLPLGSGQATIRQPADVNTMFAIYGVGYCFMCLAILLLHGHAWRRRTVIELSAWEAHETVTLVGVWGIQAVVGLISTGIALTTKPSMVGYPGWVYMLLPVAIPVFVKHRDGRAPPVA